MPGSYFLKAEEATNKSKSEYAKGVNAIEAPILAGISGTLDRTFAMAGIVGRKSKEDLIKLRLLSLAWMIPSDDHTIHEIMTSATNLEVW
jgi:hypothetical protein